MAFNIKFDILANDGFSKVAESVQESVKGIQEAARGSTRQLGKLTQKLQRVGEKASALGRALSLRVAAPMAAFFGLAIAAASEEQDAFAQVQIATKRLGNQTKLTAKDLREIANQFQDVTKFGDEGTQKMEAFLLGFKGIGNLGPKAFKKVVGAVLDFATASGRDARRAVQAFGQALADPLQGITLLKTEGVLFTEKQQKLIKVLVTAGKTSAAQKIIIDSLSSSFRGAADAAGKTFGGQLVILKNAMGDALKPFGFFLLKIITPFISKITEAVKSLGKMPKSLQIVVAGIGALAIVIPPLLISLGFLAALLPFLTKGFGILRISVLATRTAFLFLLANPIVFVIAAISAAIILLILNWKLVRSEVQKVIVIFNNSNNIFIQIARVGIKSIVIQFRALITIIKFLITIFVALVKIIIRAAVEIKKLATEGFEVLKKKIMPIINLFEKLVNLIQKTGNKFGLFSKKRDAALLKAPKLGLGLSQAAILAPGRGRSPLQAASGFTASVLKSVGMGGMGSQAATSHAKVDVTIKDPSNVVQSVKTKSRGDVEFNVGQNFLLSGGGI